MDDETYFAVKTCSKYHQDRLKSVQDTWGALVTNIDYISDSEDDQLHTRVLPYTINTEAGHCNKTIAILEHFLTNVDDARKYLVIVDDDTVLGVSRLVQLISCYSSDPVLMLGQRYGYMAATGQGYNYPTGGAGMVFSREAVKKLLDAGCRCSAPDTPDDMLLGRCAVKAGIPLLHSNR